MNSILCNVIVVILTISYLFGCEKKDNAFEIAEKKKIIECYTAHTKAVYQHKFAEAFIYRDSNYRNMFKHSYELFKRYNDIPEERMHQFNCEVISKSIHQLKKSTKDTMSFNSFVEFSFSNLSHEETWPEFIYLKELKIINDTVAKASVINRPTAVVNFIKEDKTWKVLYDERKKRLNKCNDRSGHYATDPYMDNDIRSFIKYEMPRDKYGPFNYKALIFPTFDDLENYQMLLPANEITSIALNSKFSVGRSTYTKKHMLTLAKFENLEYLNIGSDIVEETGDYSLLLDEISKLTNLKQLNLEVPIKDLPSQFINLTNLELLYINLNGAEIPKEIFKLKKLKTLIIKGNKISILPSEIGQLRQLESLYLNRVAINKLPEEIKTLNKLNTLVVSNKIDSIENFLPYFSNLEHLEISGIDLKKCSTSLQRLKSIKLKYPESIDGLEKLKSLELLYIYSNKELNFKSELQNLKKLKALHLVSERILLNKVPTFINHLVNLEYLHFNLANISNLDLDCEALSKLSVIQIPTRDYSNYPLQLCGTKIIIIDKLTILDTYLSKRSLWNTIQVDLTKEKKENYEKITFNNNELSEIRTLDVNDFDSEFFVISNMVTDLDFETFKNRLNMRLKKKIVNTKDLEITYNQLKDEMYSLQNKLKKAKADFNSNN